MNDIGLHSWEEVDIVTKGGNYGYSQREGDEVLIVPGGGKTGTQSNPQVPFPASDLLTVDGLEKPVAPIYPVAVYSHEEGDSIGSGFVYRGKKMPQMVGKYIFTDMTTGRLFYTDLAEMIATHGERDKQAAIHEIQVMYKSPYDASEKAPVKRRMYDIVADAFAHKDGVVDPVTHQGVLPGGGERHRRLARQDFRDGQARSLRRPLRRRPRGCAPLDGRRRRNLRPEQDRRHDPHLCGRGHSSPRGFQTGGGSIGGSNRGLAFLCGPLC